MSAVHRIRRQRWQVRTASAADAFTVRAALRRESELGLLPALESAFAELDDGKREIRLPRLDLAIRISSPDRLADELPAKLAEAARQALSEAIDGAPSMQTVAPTPPTAGERLRHYLRNGRVEWFDTNREPDELRQQLADEARQWSASPASAWPILLADLPPDGQPLADAFFRFLQLLDIGDRLCWWEFAAGLAIERDASLPLAVLRRMAATRPADRALRLQALGLLALSHPAPSAAQRDSGVQAARACAAQLGSLAAADEKDWPAIESWLGGASGRPTDNPHRTGPHPADATRPQGQPPEEQPGLPTGREQQPAPGMALRSAGLVLLHPYLPRLFAALGWIEAAHPQGERFPWERLAHAAALLNWLATGRDEPFEFELGTAKLLLGLRPDDPLPAAAGLIGDAEREEGAALLTAVVQHWSALGQTSIDGLRVAFLQRGGLLYPAPDGWLLRPQGETFDLLLDRLPWGLSIVRLPWMPCCLHTEWLSA